MTTLPHFRLLYDAGDYLVIDKAPGVSVHRDSNERGLISDIAEQLGYKQLFLVHRLDKMTSGLLLLATHAEAAAELSQKFQQRQMEKYYLALSDSKPAKKQGLIKGDMQKARRGSWKLSKTLENPAITRFLSVSLRPGLRLFLLRPETGKTHQLRVALKSIGAAILGDSRYHGHQAESPDRGYLHAWYLAFDWRGERREYVSPPLVGELFQLPELEAQLELWSPPTEQAWPAKKQIRKQI